MDSSFFMQPPYGCWNQPYITNDQINQPSQPEPHQSQSQSQAPWMVRSLNQALPMNKGTNKIFHKTRVCKRFWSGYCRKGDVCTFAHGIEELRQPPPNWQEMVGPEPVKETERPSSSSVSAAQGTTVESCINKSKKIKCIYGDCIDDDVHVGQE